MGRQLLCWDFSAFLFAHCIPKKPGNTDDIDYFLSDILYRLHTCRGRLLERLSFVWYLFSTFIPESSHQIHTHLMGCDHGTNSVLQVMPQAWLLHILLFLHPSPITSFLFLLPSITLWPSYFPNTLLDFSLSHEKTYCTCNLMIPGISGYIYFFSTNINLSPQWIVPFFGE